jgi:protein-disulfide isomerase
VLLCYAQGIEPSEIARRQGIPAGTVRWRLKRGLDDVRAKLDTRYGNDRKAWVVVLGPLAARTVAGAGAASMGRAFTFKAAAVAAAVTALGVGALSWLTPSRPAPTAVVELAQPPSPQSPRTPPGPPKLLAAAPGAGAPSNRPGGAPPLAAAVAAPDNGPVDIAAALNRAAEPGDSPVRGNPKAPVTIVMYSEFQCPFCSKVVPTLGELLALYPNDLRFVWKHLPLPFHESALLASEAALAAGEQGKFWQMHDRLFANQDKLDPASLEEHAKAIGVDVAKFKLALDSGKFRKRVEADLQLAKEAKISGTPTFLINGEMFTGAQPLEAFKQRVDEALAKLKGLPPTPRPVSRHQPLKPGQPHVIISPFWPPPKVTLPDALLGERLNVPVVTGNAPTRGNAKAAVEILYFTSLSCGDCFRARMVLDELLKTYGNQVRVVAKVLPRRGAEEGTAMAEAARAAAAAGKFWEFHDIVTRGQRGPGEPKGPEEALEEAGLNPNELRASLNSGRYRAAVLEEAEALRGTKVGESAFVVNGRIADGTVALLQLVEAGIKKAGQKPPPWPTPPTLPEGHPARNIQPMLSMHMSGRQIFAAEPRDEVWAAPIEKELGPLMEKDLRAIEPKVSDVSLECKSSLCRLRWRAGKGDPKALASAVNFLYALPSGGRPAFDESAYFLFLRSNISGTEQGATAESAIARIKARRSTMLYNVRTGRATAPGPLTAERLPKL